MRTRRVAQTARAFRSTGARHADPISAAVDRGITQYLARWTAARQAACDATYRDGSEPLSVSTTVGFIALLGQVSMAGLMISRVDQRRVDSGVGRVHRAARVGVDGGADDRPRRPLLALSGCPIGQVS